jgi:predicted lipoprotein with Yx(FWY)xxD motif
MKARLSLSALVFVVAAVIAVIVTTSGGGTSQARSQTVANGSISVTPTPLGRTLTDAHGRVLYLFAPDTPGMSTLSAAGRAVWPRFTSTGRPGAMGGAQASQIGAVSGAGGAAQVTYHGHPLYYFVGDRGPGQVTGEGLNEFGGRWYVLSTAGGAVTAAPHGARALSGATGSSAAGGARSGSPSYGYGY